jgi:predicted ATPase
MLAALRLPDQANVPSVEALLTWLHERQVLLVLDNCEHLLEACARLADTLLRACPRLSLLTTSREPLGLGGEAVFPVVSLPFPKPVQALSPSSLTDYPSIKLFADRARLVLPSFALSPHNAAAIARICQRLDGIPLAIEMAAARVNLLAAEQLADRLDDAFSILTGGSRTALPRQQTLRATMDWSYQLLSAQERLLFQRLSVFAGSCALEAAETICSGEGLGPGEVLGWLSALVAKSLVIVDGQLGQEMRYRLLELIRQYAQEKLDAAGDSARFRRCHRNYYSALAESIRTKLMAQDHVTWRASLQSERDNLRLALEWSFSDSDDPEAGPKLVGLMGLRWSTHEEHFAWSTRAVAFCQGRDDIAPALYAQLLLSAAPAMALDNPHTALEWVKEAVAINRRVCSGDDESLMWSWCSLGKLYLDLFNEYELAEAAFSEAEATFRQRSPEKQDLATWAHFVNHKAELADRRDHPQEAKHYAAESLRLYREASARMASIDARVSPLDSIDALVSLGTACVKLGEYDQARGHFIEALALTDEYPDVYVTNRKANVMRRLGLADLGQGNAQRARAYFQESIGLCAQIEDHNIMASCLGLLAAVAAKEGFGFRAARLSGAAQAMYARQKRKPWEDSSLDRLLPGWREGPDQKMIVAAFAEGQAMTLDQAAEYALAQMAS